MINIRCKNCGKDFNTHKSKTNRRCFCSKLCHSTFKSYKMLGNKYSKGSASGELGSNWKGEDVGYWGIHKWISRKLGQPKHCAECGSTSSKCYDWANISHSYKRDFSDWVRLCRKCHISYDKGNLNLIIS